MNLTNTYKTPAILILWLVLIQYSCCRAQSNMQAIQFIPKAFHDVKLSFDERTIHALTPHYPEPDFSMLNEIAINIPQKIIIDIKETDCKPIIPLCGYAVITRRRGLKFADYDEELGEYAACNAIFIHIKKTDEEEWFSGEMFDNSEDESPDADDYSISDFEKRLKEIEEAQKYTLEELDTGTAGAGAINIDVLSFVKVPLTTGFYDIYIYR